LFATLWAIYTSECSELRPTWHNIPENYVVMESLFEDESLGNNNPDTCILKHCVKWQTEIRYCIRRLSDYVKCFHLNQTTMRDLDGWTEHLVVSYVRRPTNFLWRRGFIIIIIIIIIAFQFYPDVFRHMVAILRGSWVPYKLLKWCCV
jgi:hypothetical protein